MRLYVVSVGMGNPALLTGQAKESVALCGCLIGAQRMLDCFPESRVKKIAASTPEKMAAAVCGNRALEPLAVLVSGDCGFFSAAKGLTPFLECEDVQFVPGISSLQYLCAKLRFSWEDVCTVSLHAGEQDLMGMVARTEKTFVLTGGRRTVQEICTRLCENECGDCQVYVGERLSYPEESLTSATAKTLCSRTFDPLSVLLIHNPDAVLSQPPATHGLPDKLFLRGDVPMTKEEVRAVALAKLRLRRDQTIWDVGAGTGSISVEAARVLPDGVVYAVEKKEEALVLLEQNRRRFNVSNVEIVRGAAPEALVDLPVPDAVFFGGSSGGIAAMVDLVLQRNPNARLVANAITLETVGAVLDSFKRHHLPEQEIIQVAVSKSKLVGEVHMMIGQNPVYILSAGGTQP